jgi:hypothetical protein
MSDLGIWAWFVILPLLALWVGAVIDIVKRIDLSKGVAAAWIIGILVFPIVGLVAYMAARPSIVTHRGPLPTPEELEHELAAPKRPPRYDRWTKS